MKKVSDITNESMHRALINLLQDNSIENITTGHCAYHLQILKGYIDLLIWFLF